MAAPSGTVWGSIVGGYGRIGIYVTCTETSATKAETVAQIWFWSKYSVDDSNNMLYYGTVNTSTTDAKYEAGSQNINTTVDSGEGWSTSNQQLLWTYTYENEVRRAGSTHYRFNAKLANVDRVGGTMSAQAPYSVPSLDSYIVAYNANGGSGAPSKQTKYYGMSLTLSSTKPTRTGYTFKGWATSASGSVAYNPGDAYTGNAAITLYAVWQPHTYSVEYSANGGVGAPDPQTKTYGVTLKLSSTKPTRNKYAFKGWGTSPSATTVVYAPGASYTNNAHIALYAIWEQTYKDPRITNYSVTRCDANGSATEKGTYALVKFSWAVDATLSSISIKHATIADPDNVTSTPVTASGTSGDVSAIIGNGALSFNYTYEIAIVVTDAEGSSTRFLTLSSMLFPIDVRKKGKGAAVGKPAELDDTFDINWITRMREKAVLSNNKGIFGIDPTDGLEVDAFKAQNENGNTVVGWGNYERKKGNTNVYGFDVNIGVSNIPNPGTYRPYRRQGDSLTFTIRTAGFVTNAGKDVSFYVPFSVPIIGAPVVTVTSINGFVLRQDNKYTHGSASSTYIVPDSYSANVAQWLGVYITAHFTDVTNVVNNDAIGIYWNGTIAFS